MAALSAIVLALGMVAGPEPTPTVTAAPKATPPDRPIRWRFDVSLGPAATYVTDPAFLGLSHRRSTIGAAPQLALTWRIGATRRVFIGGGAQYRSTRQAGDLYGSFSTDLAMDEVMFFGRAGLVFVEGVDLYLDMGGGPSVNRVHLQDNQSGPNARDKDILGVFDSTVGLALYLPKKWLPKKGRSRVTAGLSGNIGYTFRSALRVNPMLQLADDAISTRPLPLGDVTMQGLSWRLGIFVRFM